MSDRRNRLPFGSPRIDFRESFRCFIAEHGQPVDLKDKLLFRDAWQWASNLDYSAGPLEPPTDPLELQRLKRIYFSERRNAVLQQIAECEKLLSELRRVQEKLSLPLFVEGRRVWDKRQGRWRRLKPQPLDLQDVIDQLAALTDEQADCDKELNDLRL